MIADAGRRWETPMFTAGTKGWRPAVAAFLGRLQVKAMRENFPGMRLVLDLPWISIWEGEIRPLSCTYRIRVIDHRGMDDGRLSFVGRWPIVRVISPVLSPSDAGDPVPHLFGAHDDPRGAHLCLFYPDGKDWSDEMPIAESIMAWTAEWLFYYEMWQVIGTWGGEEAPHGGMPSAGRPGGSGIARRLRRIDAPVMRSMAYHVARIRPAPRSIAGSLDLAA